MRRGNITVFSKATLAALAGVLVLGLLLGSSATVHAQNQPPLFLTQPYLVSPDPQDSMYICWLTSEPIQKSYVEYGRFMMHDQEKAVRYEIDGLLTVDSQGNSTGSLDGKVFQQIMHLKGL